MPLILAKYLPHILVAIAVGFLVWIMYMSIYDRGYEAQNAITTEQNNGASNAANNARTDFDSCDYAVGMRYNPVTRQCDRPAKRSGD